MRPAPNVFPLVAPGAEVTPVYRGRVEMGCEVATVALPKVYSSRGLATTKGSCT